jgi:two-component system LytT family response regulator
MNLNVVIIDDEPDAVSALSALIEQFIEGVKIAGTAHNVLEGIKTINRTKPDVVLLDVDMPGGSGFDLLEAFPERSFKVIFTTASSGFALKALKAKAQDYLLKPVDLDELEHALAMVYSGKQKKDITIPLPDKGGYTYVNISDIIHLDGDGNYTTVYYGQNDKTIVSKNIKYFENLLDPRLFFRCHQSHIINPLKVKQLKKNEGTYLIMSNGNRVEVSRANKDRLMELLNG